MWLGLVVVLVLAPFGVGGPALDSGTTGVSITLIEADVDAAGAGDHDGHAMGAECAGAGSHCSACAALLAPVPGSRPPASATYGLSAPAIARHRSPDRRFRPPIRST